MPGPPLGILVKSSLPRLFWSSKQKGQWSVETTCRWSCRSPSQSLGKCFLGRKGGVNTYLAPSKLGRSSSSDRKGTVVGGNHLQVVVPEPVPEFGQVLFGPQGWGEYVLGAFEIGPLQLFDGEQQILRAGFGEGRNAAVARLAHLIERVFRRQMENVNRRAGDLRHGDGAVYRLRLGAHRTREGMIDGRGLSFGQSSRDNHVDHAAVFGVHADERAVLRRSRQRLEYRSEEHTSELQSLRHLVCRLLLEKTKPARRWVCQRP